MIDQAKLRRSLDQIGRHLVSGEYESVGRLTGGKRLSTEEISAAVAQYGRQLVIPPSGHFEPRSIVAISGSNPEEWSVYVDLWTAEEGRSDLTAEVTLRDSPGQYYEIELDDLHVL